MAGNGRIKMGLKEKDEKPKHNMDWINANYNYAKKWASENCPFKRLNEQLNDLIESGVISSFSEASKYYNMYEFNTFKIEVSETHLRFVLLHAKNSGKIPEVEVISYEIEPLEFISLLNEKLKQYNAIYGLKLNIYTQ